MSRRPPQAEVVARVTSEAKLKVLASPSNLSCGKGDIGGEVEGDGKPLEPEYRLRRSR
jgi:hypothetical protein